MAYEDFDYSGIESQLKQRAQQKGLAYDPSDLEGIKRNASYTGPGTTAIDPMQGLQNAFGNYDQRASNTPGPQQAPQYTTPTQAWNAQPSAQPQGQSSDIYKLLMDRIQAGSSVDRNDPLVRQQVDPAVAQQERQSRNYIDDVAERSGPLANIQGERRLASERSGQAAGVLESETIARLQAQRAEEIQQELALYGSLMSADKRMALERELAQMSDSRAAAGQQLQSRSLDQNNDQFLRELALRESNQNNLWDFNWASFGV